jgi:hypothetical protein
MATSTIKAAKAAEEQELNTVESEPKAAKLTEQEEMQKKIAELEAKLAAERARSAGYRAGNDAEVVEKAIQDAIAAGKKAIA